MKYQIEMLNVEAADAFIIYCINETNKEYLILVDSGNYKDGNKILSHIKKYYPTKSIDLAIVTHPDKDHYGGFINMLEQISNKEGNKINIEKFWVHDPANHIDKGEVKWITKQSTVNVNARTVYDLEDHDNLISLIDKLRIPREEKFSSKGCDKEFPFINIIGPEKEFFKGLVPDFRNDELNFFKKEGDENYKEDEDEDNVESLSKTLDEAKDDTSAHNQSSLIFLFTSSGNKKYLFMGDAGKLAYKNIIDSKKELIKDVSWLKVPHHGSKHNLDSNMIKYINPETAYISTAGIGNFLNQCTVNSLKKSRNNNCEVYSTHKSKSNFLHNGIEPRTGYSKSEPL